MDEVEAAHAWAASGAMALTGRADGPPLVPPVGIVERICTLGGGIDVDPLPLLAERADALGLSRHGSTSCGGAARLVRAADAWIAVNLARADDVDALAAWLEVHQPDGDPWATVERAAATRPAAELVERAALLGLPVGRVAECAPPECTLGLPVSATQVSSGRRVAGAPAVVDLSSLWAGPLCARLLRSRGAEVTKIESTARPDGARRGSPSFFERMHAGSDFASLDFATAAGRAELRARIENADVVIEASRPRALRQLGIDADAMLKGDGPAVWLSITGYGRDSDRVAFGDDAAAAGGLVTHEPGHAPGFVADAVADPLAGVTAAAAVAHALAAGGRWLVDVSMAGVAAFVTGADRAAPWRAA